MFVLAAAQLAAQTNDAPVRAVTDPGVITTRQAISPAGVPAIFNGRVYAVDFGADAREVWITSATHVYRLDWRENKVLEQIALGGAPGLQGLRFDTVSKRALATSAVDRKQVRLSAFADNKQAVLQADLGTVNAGSMAVAAKPNPQGVRVVAVPMIQNNELAVADAESGKVLLKVKTGIAPFGVVLNETGTVAWVSNWGGPVPKDGMLTGPLGRNAGADRVSVDARGVANAGNVVRIDLASGKITHTVAVDAHPNAMAWDEKKARLYVASSNRDSVTVIDSAAGKVLRRDPVQPFQRDVKGIAPTAAALSADGSRLYVACGGINAVAVMNTASGKVEGLIPTAWYPNAVALSADGKHLAIGALLGAGSAWRDEPKQRFVHAYRGAVNVVDIPDAAQLASYTTAAAHNNHMTLGPKQADPVAVSSAKPTAIPRRAGEPSLIEHVVFIIKENRTYDQLFGDLKKGNGDPSLVMFGADVTPNQRRMAEQFVVLDNFYATGGNSADGHQWITQANENAYAMWPGFHGRSYPFDGSDALAISESGFLWDAALARGRTVRIYGEYAGVTTSPSSRRREYLERWEKGEKFLNEWSVVSPVASMNKVLAKNFPAYSTAIPDVVRADIFMEDLKQWEKQAKMPNLVLVQLPSDHTSGLLANGSTPKAMVADNDLATGRIVEALSKSPFWKKMAIFITEDDAQNGVDHVDGHRTIALAVSPYIRRGHVDSTFYAHQSILKTIELILGLPTLSLFDLIATEMRASFTDTPDFTPFEAVVPQQSLMERNPSRSALKGKALEAAKASAKMKWHIPDAAPTERVNRILWGAIRGWEVPYPGVKNAVFAPLSLDVDDDDR
ncbi:MAG: alkaline phosphatase family protein [Bryobacteraceae bacterium]